ncbi:MAG: NAD(P)-dependent oxidoreductase [Janthinobacterium lividum]
MFVEATIHLFPTVLVVLGLAGDGYAFDARSNIAANSGNRTAGIATLEAAIAWTPIRQIELCVNYGRGFHLNGIVVLGRIGHATARRLATHEMTVQWWGPRDKADADFARAASLEALAAQSDVLIVTSRAEPENAGPIDAGVLRALGREGLLINVSRGFLVDEPALIAALHARTIAGAALDVFIDEPTDPARWRDLDNVLLSPHIAGYTREAGADMIDQLKKNAGRYLRGEPLLTAVIVPSGAGCLFEDASTAMSPFSRRSPHCR